MKYWLDVHYPRRVNERRHDFLKVRLRDNNYKALEKMKAGDRVFIYETTSNDDGFIEYVENGKRGVAAQIKGRKGIVALVQIVGSFINEYCEFGGYPFKGHYLTRELPVERHVIPLDEYNKARSASNLTPFIPYTPGGLIELHPEDAKILLNLMKSSDS